MGWLVLVLVLVGLLIAVIVVYTLLKHSSPPAPPQAEPPSLLPLAAPLPVPEKPSSPPLAEVLPSQGEIVPLKSNKLAAAAISALRADSYAPDPAVRALVVAAIAEGMETASPKQIAAWLPILSRLGRDPEVAIRQQAVQTLGRVSSSRVIPLLRQALHDADPTVVQFASVAINRFKGRSRRQANLPPRRLPKNR
jgi:hypothetical protein